MELLRIAREQLDKYDSVVLREIGVTDIFRIGEEFEVVQSDGARVCTRMILLATGLTDKLPEVEVAEAIAALD